MNVVERDGNVFIKLENDPSIDRVSRRLYNIIDEQIDKDNFNFIINGSNLKDIGKEGIARLIILYKKIESSGGSISFVSLNKQVKDKLKEKKLDTLFPILEYSNYSI